MITLAKKSMVTVLIVDGFHKGENVFDISLLYSISYFLYIHDLYIAP